MAGRGNGKYGTRTRREWLCCRSKDSYLCAHIDKSNRSCWKITLKKWAFDPRTPYDVVMRSTA